MGLEVFLLSLKQQEFVFIIILAVLSSMHCSYINQELGSNLRASLVRGKGKCWRKRCEE